MRLFLETFASVLAFWMVVSSVRSGKNPSFIVVHDRAELISYNKAYANNVRFKFGRVNRTTNGLTCSFDMLKDVGPTTKAVLTVYKFYSNTYVLVPTTVQFNLCEAWKNNVYGIQDMKDFSNFTICNIKKGQHFSMENYTPTFKYPPFLPLGSYRLSVDLEELGKNAMHLYRFARVIPRTSK